MKDDGTIVGWFSLDNGQHVPLRKGESKKEATQKFLSNKTSRVARNRDKYNKIDDFRKRKSTNTLKKDDEDIEYLDLDDKKEQNSRLSQFDVSDNGTKYRLKPEEREKVFRELGLEYQEEEKVDRENFYEKLGKWHAIDSYGKNKAETGEFYYKTNDNELQKEIYDKLDPIVEKGGTPTKEQVRDVIENYRQRKLGTKTQRDMTPSKNELEALRKEYNYLTKEMERLASGRQFWVRDNPSNPSNYMMGNKDFMSAEERREYEKVKKQRDAIHDRISKLR